MLDIKITGGTVYDGTGRAPVKTDVGINKDAICKLGNLNAAESHVTIEASGLAVCPGFIDAHSHSDTYLLIDPFSTSKIFQGITTEIVGNCGSSAAPLYPPHRMPSDWEAQTYPAHWRTMEDYRMLLERIAPAVNVAPLVGHRNLRVAAMGFEHRRATFGELEMMKRLLEEALDQGGRGLSTGLIYAPSSSADVEEISALTGIVAAREGVYTSHMRNEGSALIAAIEETLLIARKSGVTTEISHLKASGRQNWPLIDTALSYIDQAIDSGLPVAADRYPYTTGYTDLDVVLPDWAHDGGRENLLARLADRGSVDRIRKDLLNARDEEDWACVIIGSTSHPDNTRFRGQGLTDVAASLDLHPVDAIIHLAKTDKLQTTAFFGGMKEENMRKVLATPWVMVGTDASLRTPGGTLGQDFPHPRAYGTYARYFDICSGIPGMSLAEAIRKVTSLPARHFGLKGRGLIKKGNYADLVIFDPDNFKDHSNYSNPHQLTAGIKHLCVNGQLTIHNTRLTSARAGMIL
ncbi:MAG: N-acyl-D-amino-acid deacylase family protein [Verrucomicrobiota bacterium]